MSCPSPRVSRLAACALTVPPGRGSRPGCPTKAERLAANAAASSGYLDGFDGPVDGKTLVDTLIEQGYTRPVMAKKGFVRDYFIEHPVSGRSIQVDKDMYFYALHVLSESGRLTGFPVPPEIEAILRELRAEAPADRYGYRGHLLSPQHGIRERAITGLTLPMSAGYNCDAVNSRFASALRAAGLPARLVSAKDAAGLFSEHIFVELDGQTYDATPLYPPAGAPHDKYRRELELESDGIPGVINPVEVVTDPPTGERLLFILGGLSHSGKGEAERASLVFYCANAEDRALNACTELYVSLDGLRSLFGPQDRPYLSGCQAARPLLEELIRVAGHQTCRTSAEVRRARQQPLYKSALLDYQADTILAVLHKLAYPEQYPD